MVYIKPLKIKYGEITRRLNVGVNRSDNIPDLDITRLKAKIFEFFNFAKDTEITLTYIDGDGDTLTLVNTDDVRDVIWPDKCYKIYVHLRSDNNTQSHDGSACSCLFSEVLKHPSQQLSSQFLLDLASKATAAGSLFAELAHCVTRVANTHLNSDNLQASVSSNEKVAIESTKKVAVGSWSRYSQIC